MCESDTRSHGRGYREIGRGEQPRTPQKGKRGYREIGRDGTRGERPRTPPKGKRGYRESGKERAREGRGDAHLRCHAHDGSLPPPLRTVGLQRPCDQPATRCFRICQKLRLAPQCFHIRLVLVNCLRYIRLRGGQCTTSITESAIPSLCKVHRELAYRFSRERR